MTRKHEDRLIANSKIRRGKLTISITGHTLVLKLIAKSLLIRKRRNIYKKNQKHSTRTKRKNETQWVIFSVLPVYFKLTKAIHRQRQPWDHLVCVLMKSLRF